MRVIKEQNAIITIEASLSFVVFMFLILFIYSYSNVYIAQNIISHATIQANQTVAIESYGRQKLSDTQINKDIQKVIGDINSLGNQLFGTEGMNPFNDFKSLENADIKKVYQKAWLEAISNQAMFSKEDDYIQALSAVGIDTSTIKFDVQLANADDGGTDIVATVTYDLNLQFPFMGKNRLENITKQSKSHLFQNVNNKRSVSWTGI